MTLTKRLLRKTIGIRLAVARWLLADVIPEYGDFVQHKYTVIKDKGGSQ